MKKQILRAAVLGIITLFSYTFADAQTSSPIVIDVKFDFNLGDKKMTAGEYVVEQLNPFTNKNILALRRKDGKAEMLMIADPVVVTKKGDVTLLFNRYGDEYYLSEIRNPSDGSGARFRQGKTEKNLARQFGKAKPATASLNSRTKQNIEITASPDWHR